MELAGLLITVALGAGFLGYVFGARVEAASWKRVLQLKGFALSEVEKLRKLL